MSSQEESIVSIIIVVLIPVTVTVVRVTKRYKIHETMHHNYGTNIPSDLSEESYFLTPVEYSYWSCLRFKMDTA
jgi:hypothetical protein